MSLITYVSPAMLQSAFRWIERRRRGHVSKHLQVNPMAPYPPGALQNFKNSAQFGEIIRFIHAKQANRSRFSSQP